MLIPRVSSRGRYSLKLNFSAVSSQGVQERLMVLFPQDVLLLSVDNKRLNIRYEVV